MSRIEKLDGAGSSRFGAQSWSEDSIVNAGPIPVGETLDGKYHVRRLLGRGSMGLVYLGADLQLERFVAIKALSPKYAADQRLAKRFRLEAVAMASVRAENVVQIFSYGDYANTPYFVMEYVPGYTVAHLIESANQRSEQLYLDVVLGILRQVCRGLQAVHDRGIVHRDVKPANMLIGPRFRVAITDFGLVERIAEAHDERDLAGTPLYLAPELIRRQGLPDTQLHLSDVYALGVATYEMLTGEPPHDGRTIREILHKHLHDEPTPVSEIRADVPRAVDAVMSRAMAKTPEQRYSSCVEFMQALESARQQHTRRLPRVGTTKILIAEDDPEMRTICAAALKVGFPEATILTADDGLKALESARCARPDLIIVDMNMPGMNGLELVAALRGDELTGKTPLLVLTAKVDDQSRTVLDQLGICDIVLKPVELNELVQTVRSHLVLDPRQATG